MRASGAAAGDLPPPAIALQTAVPRPRGPALAPVLLSIALLVLVAWVVLARFRTGRTRHQRAMSAVLDAADALEARLRTARSEIEAVAGDGGGDPVREALQEMLRQRLWLQQHGQAATPRQLDSVRTSIDAARARIEQQLGRIERARAPTP